jgi:hypothetical protein
MATGEVLTEHEQQGLEHMPLVRKGALGSGCWQHLRAYFFKARKVSQLPSSLTALSARHSGTPRNSGRSWFFSSVTLRCPPTMAGVIVNLRQAHGIGPTCAPCPRKIARAERPRCGLLHDYMRHRISHYYVDLLSAAALHGSSSHRRRWPRSLSCPSRCGRSNWVGYARWRVLDNVRLPERTT